MENELLMQVGIGGISRFGSELEGIINQTKRAADQATQSMANITNQFTKGLLGSIPVIGQFTTALTNPAQAAAQLGATLGNAIGGWISDANEAAQVSAQLDAVLKSTGQAAGVTKEQVEGLADSLAKVTLYEDDAIKSSSNLLLTFTSIGKDIFPRAQQAVLDLSTAFNQDLKASSIQLGKALQDPIAGVSALRRVGVQMSASQEALIKSLVETGNSAEAQRVILAELEKQVKGSAEAAANSGSGPWLQFKKQLGELGETIGATLIPIINAIGMALKPIVNILAAVTGALGPATIAIGGLTAAAIALGSPLIAAVAALTALYNILPTLASGLSDVVEYMNGFHQATIDFANAALHSVIGESNAALALFSHAAAKSDTAANALAAGFKTLKKDVEDAYKSVEHFEKGSLRDLETQLQLVNKQINTTNPDAPVFYGLIARADELQQKIKEIQDTVQALQQPDAFVVQPVQAMSTQLEVTTMTRGDISGFREFTEEMNKQAEATKKQIELSDELKNSFRDLGKAVGQNVAMAFGELAFNVGVAIANGEKLGDVMKQFLADLLAQVGKMVGLAMIQMALTAPFPLSLALLAGGLLVLGLSGLASGALSGGKDKKGSTPGANIPSPDTSPQAASPGLSSFGEAETGFVIDNNLYIDGQQIAIVVNEQNRKMDKRRNG